MNDPLNIGQFYNLMIEAKDRMDYLSGESYKVLVALALRPESRNSLQALKVVTCMEDDVALIEAISGLEDMNFARFDGKGGIVLNEGMFALKRKP